MPRFRPTVLLGAGVAAAYAGAAYLGFGLALVAEQITMVWAPTGIAIATLLLCGVRLWPAIWLGAFAANASTTAPLWTAAVIATGNTLEAAAAAWALQRLRRFDPTLRRVGDVVRFLLIAAALCTAISATLGVAVLCVAGVQEWHRFGTLWWDWWLGDALGAVIVAPAILTVVRQPWHRHSALRAAAFAAGTAIVTHLAFGLLDSAPHPIEYLVFPLVIAAAVSGGPAVTTLAVLGASIVAIWHTALGAGPFAGPELHASLVLLQVFLGVLAGSALLLATAVAERRASETREREGRHVLALAMRGGAMGAWARQLATNEVWWSRELEEIFGLEASAFSRTEAGFFEFVHEEDRLAVRKAVDDAVARHTDYIVEFRFWHARGEWRWMEGRGRAVYEDGGTPRTLHGIGIDITDRKHAEMALADANRELARRVLEQQTLLDVLPIGIGIAMDPECRDIRINRAFARTLGLSEGTNASKTAPDGERPTNFRVFTAGGEELPGEQLPMQVAAREGREVPEVELDIVHADGRIVRLLEYAAPLLDEHGRPRGAVGAFVDVTAAHHARDTLAQSEARYRRIFETAGVPLLEEDFVEVKAALDRIDAGGAGGVEAYLDAHPDFVDHCVALVRAVDVNHAAIQMFRATEKDALLASLDRIYRPGTRELFKGELLALARGDRRYQAQAELQALDGQPLDVLVSVTFPGPGEPLDSVLVGLTDITARKRAEDDLRHEVELRAALHREAEEANRLKDEFLATLSHELRTPLNAVLGWAYLLRQGAMEPAMHERAVESVVRNARAQAQLVDDLLDVSGIMAGKLQLKSGAVDLRSVITNAVETVRAGVTAKRLDLHLHLPADGPALVTGDAYRLQQVVWNLVSNAIKFTPPGGRVDVELHRLEARAMIVVRDTGPGIDPAFRPRLFERFRQMDASKTRQHGGLGLGLSIVRHLVEAHGGTVAADSDGVGLGATFRVVLPLRDVEETTEGNPRLHVPAQGIFTGVHVLVVDDEADAREVTRYVLESRGASVETAASAAQALDALARERFDVLVADIGMPEQDGLDLIRAVRRLPEDGGNRNIPAIAVTAYTGAREREEALAAGFSSHLGKPVDPEQLMAGVASYLTAPSAAAHRENT